MTEKAIRKRVLLVHIGSSNSVFQPSPYVALSTFPQLGLLYLASVLRNAGYSPSYMDPVLSPVTPFTIGREAARGDLLFIGFYSNIALRNDVCELIRGIKKRFRVPVIVGGPGFFEADRYLSAGADAVVGGEAEGLIAELAKRLENGESLEGLPGLTLPGPLPRPVAAPAPPVADLNRLPRPAFDLAPPGRFRNLLAFNAKHPFGCVAASRGCRMSCAFCCQLYSKKEARYRLRDPGDVVSEVVELREAYGIRHVKFQDDCFGADREWLGAFCGEMIARAPSIKWNCSMYPLFFAKNPLPVLASMRRAGCVSIHFGLQSATPEILSRINRGPNEPEILAGLIPAMKKMGYFTMIDFIYGLPGETLGTIANNLHFAIKTGVHMVQINPINVVPRTRLFRQYEDRPLSGLSTEEIRKAVGESNRKFFSRPSVYIESIKYILRRNPGFLIKAFKVLPFAVRLATGRFPVARFAKPSEAYFGAESDKDEPCG